MNANRIVAKMTADGHEPYRSWGEKIPVVAESNHPRFPIGCRLDWGFVKIALEDGYRIELVP